MSSACSECGRRGGADAWFARTAMLMMVATVCTVVLFLFVVAPYLFLT